MTDSADLEMSPTLHCVDQLQSDAAQEFIGGPQRGQILQHELEDELIPDNAILQCS